MDKSAVAAPPMISRLLEPDERLAWWGRPKRGPVFRVLDIFMIPFSVIWFGFVLTVFSHGPIGQADPFSLAIGTLFIVFGAYITIGRFALDAWRRSRLVYVVTTQRVLIVSRSRFKSLDLESLGEIEIKRFRGGYGSISFGPVASFFSQVSQVEFAAVFGMPTIPTFEYIRHADGVYALIREQRRKAREAASAS